MVSVFLWSTRQRMMEAALSGGDAGPVSLDEGPRTPVNGPPSSPRPDGSLPSSPHFTAAAAHAIPESVRIRLCIVIVD